MRSFNPLLALLIISLAALAAGCARGGTEVGVNVNASSSPAGANSGQPPAADGAASPAVAASPAAGVAGQTASQATGAATTAQGAAAAGGANADACAMLTSDDVKAVQGEPVRESKPSQRRDGVLSVSQCFFSTATFNKSVSLEVTRSGAGQSARKFWESRFERAREEGGKGEREREREKKGEKKGEARGEEEEESLPTPVKGLGDEAYWASSHVNGILYVLKGDAFIRVSIGGADDGATRLKKSKALAQRALARL